LWKSKHGVYLLYKRNLINEDNYQQMLKNLGELGNSIKRKNDDSWYIYILGEKNNANNK